MNVGETVNLTTWRLLYVYNLDCTHAAGESFLFISAPYSRPAKRQATAVSFSLLPLKGRSKAYRHMLIFLLLDPILPRSLSHAGGGSKRTLTIGGRGVGNWEGANQFWLWGGVLFGPPGRGGTSSAFLRGEKGGIRAQKKPYYCKQESNTILAK